MSRDPSQPQFIAAGSWDSQVRLWQISGNNTEGKCCAAREAPVLSIAFSPSSNHIFAAGCDNKVAEWDLSTNQQRIVAQHDRPIKFVHAVTANNLITGGWDATLRYWDTRAQQPLVGSVKLPHGLYAADVKENMVIAATAERKILTYDMRTPGTPSLQLDSPLKFQTRSITLFPDCKGFGIGSIEGRVAIINFDQNQSANDFSFKCHREGEVIYPIHTIDFHPTLGNIFATGGGDGTLKFWDRANKQPVGNSTPKAHLPVVCAKFHPAQNVIAYAVAYDWVQGPQAIQKSAICIHPLS